MNDDRNKNNRNHNLGWFVATIAIATTLLGFGDFHAKKQKEAEKKRKQEEKKKQQRKTAILGFILTIIASIIGGWILLKLTGS